MQSTNTAAAWQTPALVLSSVVVTPAVATTRRSAHASTQLVGAVVGRMALQVEATERDGMSPSATVGNAAKDEAIAFAATPATGYGNRPRGTPLS